MLATGRPLDAEFQPASGQTMPPTDGADMVIQDFNTFFEKLSGLDDVRWNDESAPAAPDKAAPRAAAQPKAAPSPAAQPQAAAASPAPAMAAAAAPAAARPAPQGAAPRTLPPRVPGAPKAGLPLAFKLAMLALTLFAIGMGAGWLALSLPRTAGRPLAENPLIPFESAAQPSGTVAVLDADAAPAKAQAVLGVKPAESSAAKPAAQEAAAKPAAPATAADESIAAPTVAPIAPLAPSAPTIAAAEPGKDEPDAFSQSAAPAPLTGPKAAAKAPAAARQAKAPQAKTAQAKGIAAKAPAAPAQATAADAAVQYAVQVGACTSSRCVETYRKLIQPHVSGRAIDVVQMPAAGTAPAVQRIRVEPLSRADAQALKSALEQADARLQHAYIVRIADRS